ncbi:hypothetical protein THIOM_001328, partial [Candidatus Thiomargarita nelsonii]
KNVLVHGDDNFTQLNQWFDRYAKPIRRSLNYGLKLILLSFKLLSGSLKYFLK